MFFRTIFVCLVGFVLVKAEQHPPEITFEIMYEKVKNSTNITCDHTINDITKNIFTVREGEEFTIKAKYKNLINHFICSENNNNQNEYLNAKMDVSKKVITFKAEKKMGTVWNCTLLANRDPPPGILPVVHYEGANYSAAYCYMKIHVRQTNSPQTILVNNMVLQAVRTNLLEKNFDFTAEYQYADGDVVDVTCANFLKPANLTMEYEMAGTMSDKFTMKELSSKIAIGFRVKLNSGHNNSYMICTNKESKDYTKVMVRFVMRAGSNIVSITINGMTLRPKLKNVDNNYYDIEYKYLNNLYINVVCEVQRTNISLVVVDHQNSDFVGYLTDYKKRELIKNKKFEMSFNLKPMDDKKLRCSADDNKIGRSEEQVIIRFSPGNFSIDQHPLHMELPSNGTVMELYDDKKHVMYYEFEDGETLQTKCGPLPVAREVLSLQIKHSDNSPDVCNRSGCNVSNEINVTRKDENSEIVCYLKEQENPDNDIKEKLLREIRVILRERVLTTTSSTSTTSTSPKSTGTSHAGNFDASASSGVKGNNENPSVQWMTIGVIAGAALCILIICVSIVIVKLRKRNHSQGGPHNRNYKNLQTPSETSIPAYPTQWESNYAVPVDRRAEDMTYSVPFQEPVLYSTPIPKNLRNKKQKPVEPTYAILEVPNAQGRKNAFKETDDPNYSEVYANRPEQCYAKVLPKIVRNKMAQDNNPYSNVTNEPAYVNTVEPEPMYCEPAKAQGGTYANLNNAHYANSNAQEYVEPTYCELQKRTK